MLNTLDSHTNVSTDISFPSFDQSNWSWVKNLFRTLIPFIKKKTIFHTKSNPHATVLFN